MCDDVYEKRWTNCDRYGFMFMRGYIAEQPLGNDHEVYEWEN